MRYVILSAGGSVLSLSTVTREDLGSSFPDLPTIETIRQSGFSEGRLHSTVQSREQSNIRIAVSAYKDGT